MPTFRSSLFAVQENYVPVLLAGDIKPTPKRALAAGQVGIFGPLGEGDWFASTDYSSIRAGMARGLADPKVRTIDLVIDSPGGSVLGLPETAAVIQAANRIKPVRAFVTGVAASAAYWLASQASTIILTPSGEVGSVGVLDIHADVSKALEADGVRVTAVHAGAHKVERAPFTPLSDSAKAHMQSGVDDWYGEFLRAVRSGRGARVSSTGTYGDGRMLSAKAAIAAGMVDFVSSL
jgi:signal peptide peptidase SppA